MIPVIESLALVAALAQPSGQTTMKGWHISGLVQQNASTWVIESLGELDAFLSNQTSDTFQPTGHSYFTARRRLIELSALLNGKPEIILDGEGGIDIEWQKDGRLLMFACRANPNMRDYIYYEYDGKYGGADYSAIYSSIRVNWLLKG
jgi:hypothetical protein